MPSPTETLFRVQDSPVPTHTVFGACGSMAIAPIDCTGCLSNTGLYVVPPFTDFQTPPLAAPTYTVSRPSSLTAVTAAIRPLIAAEPIFREPKPEIVSESNTASWAAMLAGKVHSTPETTAAEQNAFHLRIFICPRIAIEIRSRRLGRKQNSFGCRRCFFVRLGGGHRKSRVVERNVHLDFVHGKFGARFASLLASLDGKGIINSIHLLVVTEIGLGILHSSADVTLVFDFVFQERIAIQEVVTDIAIFQGELHFVTVRALNRIMPGKLGLVPFLQIVHQRAIDIRIDQQSFSVVLRHPLWILTAGEGRNLPSDFPIVCLHLCHTLNNCLFAHSVGALVFLHIGGAKGADGQL